MKYIIGTTADLELLGVTDTSGLRTSEDELLIVLVVEDDDSRVADVIALLSDPETAPDTLHLFSPDEAVSFLAQYDHNNHGPTISHPIVLTSAAEEYTSLPRYTISASAGSYGSVSPVGDVIIPEGADQSFLITPDEGYVVDACLVDGDPASAIDNEDGTASFSFSNVTADHTIEVTFTEA